MTQPYGYFTTPDQELYLLIEEEIRAMRQRELERFATPENAQALIEASYAYPHASSNFNLGLVAGGIPAGTPVADELAYTEMQSRESLGPVEQPGEGWWDDITGVLDEWVVNPIQGAVRWTFAAWEAAYDLGAGGAPIRALQLSKVKDIPFSEAWKMQDPYFFEALGGVFAGERSNLGSGWLPNSDVADPVAQQVHERSRGLTAELSGLPAHERYAKELAAGPAIWREAISAHSAEQAELGRPLTQLYHADAQIPIFENRLGQAYPWSPGRFVAAQIVEPGTKPYTAISGTLDFGSQVVLDPVDWVGLKWAAKGLQGRQIWARSRKLAEASIAPPGTRAYGPHKIGTYMGEGPFPVHGIEGHPLYGEALQGPLIGYSNDAPLALRYSDEVDFSGIPPQGAGPGWRPDYVRIGPAKSPREAAYEAAEANRPWWVQDASRQPGPWDPPDWYIAEHRRRRMSAVAASGDPTFKRRMAGVYEMDLPRLPGQRTQKVRVQRVGKGKNAYWEAIRPDGTRVTDSAFRGTNADPRFTTPKSKFRTLREAQEAAYAEVTRWMDEDFRVNGMSVDDFIDSGEDFYLRLDGHSHMEQLEDYARSLDDPPPFRRTARSKVERPEVESPWLKGIDDQPVRGPERPAKRAPGPKDSPRDVSGVKVRVFGKTLDLRPGHVNLERLPSGLRKALEADNGKLVHENGVEVLNGFGPGRANDMENWRNTFRWMEENGYGKVIWDDNDVVVLDKFIGGNSKDPLGRVFFEDAGTPIDGLPGSPTAGEVDNFIMDLYDVGRQFDELDFDRIAREQYLKFAEESGASTAIPEQMAMDLFGDSKAFLDDFADRFANVPDEYRKEFLTPERRDFLNKIWDTMADADEPPPTFKGVRLDYDPNYKLMGKRSRMFIDRLWESGGHLVRNADGKMVPANKNIAKMDGILRFLEKNHIRVPNDVREALFHARSKGELETILARWMIDEGHMVLTLPGGTQYGRLAAMGVRLPKVSWMESSWIQRRVAMNMGQTEFNLVEDPTEGYQRFLQALPHYNISRGDVIDELDKLGNLTGRQLDIEDILTRLRQLEPNNKADAADIMSDFSHFMFASLMRGNNVDPKMAWEVSRWWDEAKDMAIWDAEQLGRINLTDGPYDATVISQELIGGIGPQLSADLWAGTLSHFPNPRTLKRVANDTDALGRVANSIALKKVKDMGPADELMGMHYEERALLRYYDDAITKLWKPFVLLRGAWTFRILLDDQARMAAEGYSMFNHPMRIINYALHNSDDWRTAFKKGFVDVYGTRFRVDQLDDMHHAILMRQSLMSRPDDIKLGTGAYGRNQITRIGREDPRYISGLEFEMERLAGTPLTKVLAGSTAEDKVDAAVRWLQGKTGHGGYAELRNIAAQHRKLDQEVPGLVERIMRGDYDTLYDIVSRQYAAMHHRLGGEVVLHNNRGQIFDWRGRYLRDEPPTVKNPNRPLRDSGWWEVTREADESLLRYVKDQNTLATDAQRQDGGVEDQLPRRPFGAALGHANDELCVVGQGQLALGEPRRVSQESHLGA